MTLHRFALFALACSLPLREGLGMGGGIVPPPKLGPTELVSQSTLGSTGNSRSENGRDAVSEDGRFVAFSSRASNFAPGGDGNGASDVFLRDRMLQTTELVSKTSEGRIGNGSSHSAAISGDGRLVAFVSRSTNLVPGGDNGWADVYVKSLQNGRIVRASVGNDGSEADGATGDPAISANGRFVAFESEAANLAPGADDGGFYDVFLRDLASGKTYLVSAGSQGDEADWRNPSISADGRRVLFVTSARLVAEDSDSFHDVYLWEWAGEGFLPTLTLISGDLDLSLFVLTAAISADGQTAAFVAYGFHGYVRDLGTGEATRFAIARNDDGEPEAIWDVSLSGDGRLVAFVTEGSTIVPGDLNRDEDVFVWNRTTGLTEWVSFPYRENLGDDNCYNASISADGSVLVFTSQVEDLDPLSAPDKPDVFARTMSFP